jgi:hypothetical protein
MSSSPRERSSLIAFGACLHAAVGCASDQTDSGARAGLRVRAELLDAPADAADAIVAWDVSSGPDYLYVWGRAPLHAGRASLDLAGPPPSEASNSYGLAIGFVVVLRSANIAHTGKLTKADETWLEQSLGASEQHAIMYVDHATAERAIDEQATPESADELRQHWLFDFSDGYSCGEARPPKSGQFFDSYTPVDCSKLQIKPGTLSELEFPNWT